MKILCKIFGHNLVCIRRDLLTALCKRCDKRLEISYDMSYDKIVVTKEL